MSSSINKEPETVQTAFRKILVWQLERCGVTLSNWCFVLSAGSNKMSSIMELVCSMKSVLNQIWALTAALVKEKKKKKTITGFITRVRILPQNNCSNVLSILIKVRSEKIFILYMLLFCDIISKILEHNFIYSKPLAHFTVWVIF